MTGTEEKFAKSKLLQRIGSNLKTIRTEKAIEVKQIAAWLHLSPQAYLNMENGKTDFAISRILELNELLDTDINTLLDIDCPGITYNPGNENELGYSIRNSPNFPEGNEASITSLLKHQLLFLQQQCVQIALMLEMSNDIQSTS